MWPISNILLQASYAASVWKAMKRIYDLDLEELDGHEINRLSNIITLCDRAAGLFNSLKLWFEADETEKVRSSGILLSL